MKKLEKLAELKYVKRLIEEEINHIQDEIDIGELERITPVHFGSFQKVNRTNYEFNNTIVEKIIGKETFLKIAKLSKTNVAAVTSIEEWNKIDKMKGINIVPSYPYLKFVHVHFPETQIRIKTDSKFHMLLKI